MEVSGQHQALAALSPEKKPRYPLKRRMCGPQSRSEFVPLLSRNLLPHQGTLAAVNSMRVCQSEDKTTRNEADTLWRQHSLSRLAMF